MTTEEKARAYAEKVFCDAARIHSERPWNEFRDTYAAAYLAGATEALASQWKDPKVELPEDGEYVLISTDRDIEPSVWNEHYQCWDDAEGDDYMYSKEYVKAWLPIPPLKGDPDTFDETDK